jgi:GT2 family glycosyltransferase
MSGGASGTAGRVTVVVVTWNHRAEIADCLAAAGAQTWPDVELVVVDNGSTDGTAELVASAFPRAALRRERENGGLSRALNRALAAATGEFFLTLNPDVVLGAGFLERALGAFPGRPDVWCVAPRLVRPDGSLDAAGVEPTPDGRFRNRGEGAREPLDFDRPGEVFGACGAAALYRTEALRSLAGPDGEVFDEDFFVYREDLDVAWRAARRGFRTWYEPAAVATHRRRWPSGGRSTVPRWVRRHSFKNRYLMLAKNADLGFLARSFGPLVRHEAAALAWTLVREPHLLLAYGQAALRLPRALRKRRLARRAS